MLNKLSSTSLCPSLLGLYSSSTPLHPTPYTLCIYHSLTRTFASLRYSLFILTNSTFRALAGDKSGALPYDADLADQRARYGDGLLRRAPEQITRQEAYESEAHARVEEVRKLRQAEAERIRAAEVCPFYPIL
jgi:hypothetical protein